MTRDRGTPEDRHTSDRGKQRQSPHLPSVPQASTPLPSVPPPTWSVSPPPTGTSGATPPPNGNGMDAYGKPVPAGFESPNLPDEIPTSPRRRTWLGTWQFWAISAVATFSGVGLFSILMLVRPPALPNCPAIFWPLASASLRLYCAQTAANKRTVKDLLEAIALVHDLPPTHPLRPEINRLIEQWSGEILGLAEESFQAGQLQEAIATARRIPNDTSAARLVNEQIQRWEKIWAEADKIYQQAEASLRQRNWPQAFAQSVRLLSVGNTYWETTKYQELVNQIRTAREEHNQLGKARELAKQGGRDNLVEAIKLAEGINPESYLYTEAQKAIAEFGGQMLDLAEATLEQKDLAGALAIARSIPKSTNLEEEAQDFMELARAQAQAWGGSINDLEAAIAQAQKVGPARPRYGKAQQLISRWQLEIEGVAYLERARQMARNGEISDLSAAIAEADLVSRTNPRWEEAREAINGWRRQIETIEDRPFLEGADQLAIPGDVISLQAAIDQANRVGQGRALYAEARGKIRKWQGQIQRIEDQPYLDQAWQFANRGNLTAAIVAAEQIRPGRALYDEAQDQVQNWRDQIRGEQYLREARQIAETRTPDALVAAIRAAEQVPSRSRLRADADLAIGQWSQQILSIARNQANFDLPAAIAIAEKIPTRTPAHADAQRQIETWKQRLQPEPPLPPVTIPIPPPESAAPPLTLNN